MERMVSFMGVGLALGAGVGAALGNVAGGIVDVRAVPQ
jgi:hypothetical protein